MDLTQIRYFLTLARALNFTRAAEACNVTQPALTKSIQRLEDELGGPLLLRERSHTQLTALGDAMLPLLQQTFDAAEAARHGAARFRTQDVTRLRLGLGAWIEPALLTPLIREVMQRVPGIELTIRHGGVRALNEWMLSSEIDVTVTAAASKLTERANRWPLFADQVVVLIPDGHPLATPGALPMDQLRAYPLVGPADEGDIPEECAIAGLHRALPVRHRAGTTEQVHAAVQAGFGLALSTARHRLPAGVISRAIEPWAQIDVVVAAIAGRPVSRAADAFLRLARARNWDAGFDGLKAA